MRDASKLTVMGFKNGTHGTSALTLSCSDQDLNVNNTQTHNWQLAPFPKTQYPMSKFEHQNKAEEDRCLAAVRE